MSNWFQRAWYDFVAVASATGLTISSSLRLDGFRHVPRQGPVLVLSNHQSYLDPVLVGVAVRRHLSYLARSTLFRNPHFTGLIRSLNAVPVNQDGFARDGLRTVLEQLKMGRAVLVFPEGERTPDGRFGEVKPGVDLLIRRMQMPVLPVGIAGAFEAWPRHRLLPRLAPIFLPAGNATLSVAIGRPLYSDNLRKLPREAVLETLATELQKIQLRAERLRRRAAEEVRNGTKLLPVHHVHNPAIDVPEHVGVQSMRGRVSVHSNR